jgi:hypothetical protein
MAAMSTALTEFSNIGNSRTYTVTGHTSSKAKLVLETRRVPSGKQNVAENVITVAYATEDADGLLIPQKASCSFSCKFPINGDTADRDAVLAVIRDIVASDEVTNTVATQEFLV